MGHRPGPGIMHVTCWRLLAQGRFRCGFGCGSATQSVPSGVVYLPRTGCWETSVFLALHTEVGWWEVRDACGWVCEAEGCVKYRRWHLAECLWLHLGEEKSPIVVKALSLSEILQFSEFFWRSCAFPFLGIGRTVSAGPRDHILDSLAVWKDRCPLLKAFPFKYRAVLRTKSEAEKQRGLTVPLLAEPRVRPASTWFPGLASTEALCLHLFEVLLWSAVLWAEEWVLVSLPSLLIRCVYFWKDWVYLCSTCWGIWAPAPVPWMSSAPKQEPSWGI